MILSLTPRGTMSLTVPLAATGTLPWATPANLRIGSLQTNLNFFAGQIDEVRLFNAALTAAQVAALP